MRTVFQLVIPCVLALTFAPVEVSAQSAVADDARVGFERTRIQMHLAHVRTVLLRRDMSRLTPEQRSARVRLLDELERYRVAGVFPRNTRHRDDYVPYFIDDSGTPCAVGRLMIADGHEGLATAIHDNENNAYVPDMTTPGILEWAAAVGFTVDDLAMIQPSYCGPAFDAAPCTPPDGGVDGGGADRGGAGTSGGCTATGSREGSGVWLALGVVLLLALRRRGRRVQCASKRLEERHARPCD